MVALRSISGEWLKKRNMITLGLLRTKRSLKRQNGKEMQFTSLITALVANTMRALALHNLMELLRELMM